MLFLFCLVSSVGCGSPSPMIYTNDMLGMQLENTSNWDIEQTERFLSLIIKPSRGKDRNRVSITIIPNLNTERELSEALERELSRLKNSWSLDEITIVEPMEEFTLNDYEGVKITIEAPVQSQNGEITNISSSLQPMEILILDADDNFLEIYFRQSTVNPDLNDDGQNIINSIKAYP